MIADTVMWWFSLIFETAVVVLLDCIILEYISDIFHYNAVQYIITIKYSFKKVS